MHIDAALNIRSIRKDLFDDEEIHVPIINHEQDISSFNDKINVDDDSEFNVQYENNDDNDHDEDFGVNYIDIQKT